MKSYIFKLLSVNVPIMHRFYTFQKSLNLTEQLNHIDELQSKIETRKPLQPELWATIQQKLRVD